jgi:SAM-dependent methyltransferase
MSKVVTPSDELLRTLRPDIPEPPHARPAVMGVGSRSSRLSQKKPPNTSRQRPPARCLGGPPRRHFKTLTGGEKRSYLDAILRVLIERLSERGVAWTALAVTRRLVRDLEGSLSWLPRTANRACVYIETGMARIERTRHLMGPGTISSVYQSYALNCEVWEHWDWSQGGEEWTQDVQLLRGLDAEEWRRSILELLEAYVPAGGAVLEIGPGAGRWTSPLLERAASVAVADVAQACVDICRERFGDRVQCFLVGEDPRVGLPSGSLDAVWSYDVFVHVNPPAADAWLREVARLLRPGGWAVIHHGGGNDVGVSPSSIGRSNLDAGFFRFLAEKNGLEVVRHDITAAHKPGDVITVCRAPRSDHA